MPDRPVDLDDCPLCELDPSFAMKTTDGTKLSTHNLVAQGTARACVAPTTMEIGDRKAPALFIVFHKVEDPEFVTAKGLQEAEEAPEAEDAAAEAEVDDTDKVEEEVEADESADDLVDASDLNGFETAIVRLIERRGHAKQAGIQGAMLDRKKSPSEVKDALDGLCEQGYLEEYEDAVYRLA